MATGRPTKLTPAVQRKLCKALADGNTRTDAARIAGIGLTTFKVWMIRGKKHKTGIFRAFRAAIKEAESKASSSMVGKIRKAANEQWQAAAWWLERRRPEDFGRKATQVIEGGKKPITVDIKDMTSDDIKRRLAILEQRRTGSGGASA